MAISTSSTYNAYTYITVNRTTTSQSCAAYSTIRPRCAVYNRFSVSLWPINPSRPVRPFIYISGINAECRLAAIAKRLASGSTAMLKTTYTRVSLLCLISDDVDLLGNRSLPAVLEPHLLLILLSSGWTSLALAVWDTTVLKLQT